MIVVWISRRDLDMELVGFSYLTIVPKVLSIYTQLPSPQSALHFSLSYITTSTFVFSILSAQWGVFARAATQYKKDDI